MSLFSILYFICLIACGHHGYRWFRGDTEFEEPISLIVVILVGGMIPILNIYLAFVYVAKPILMRKFKNLQ